MEWNCFQINAQPTSVQEKAKTTFRRPFGYQIPVSFHYKNVTIKALGPDNIPV